MKPLWRVPKRTSLQIAVKVAALTGRLTPTGESWRTSIVDMTTELGDRHVHDWDWRGLRTWNPIVEGAVKDLRTRRVVTRDEWDTLNAVERRRSFTLAYLRTADSIEPIRFEVRPDLKDFTFSEGGPKAWFSVIRREG